MYTIFLEFLVVRRVGGGSTLLSKLEIVRASDFSQLKNASAYTHDVSVGSARKISENSKTLSFSGS